MSFKTKAALLQDEAVLVQLVETIDHATLTSSGEGLIDQVKIVLTTLMKYEILSRFTFRDIRYCGLTHEQ